MTQVGTSSQEEANFYDTSNISRVLQYDQPRKFSESALPKTITWKTFVNTAILPDVDVSFQHLFLFSFRFAITSQTLLRHLRERIKMIQELLTLHSPALPESRIVTSAQSNVPQILLLETDKQEYPEESPSRLPYHKQSLIDELHSIIHLIKIWVHEYTDILRDSDLRVELLRLMDRIEQPEQIKNEVSSIRDAISTKLQQYTNRKQTDHSVFTLSLSSQSPIGDGNTVTSDPEEGLDDDSDGSANSESDSLSSSSSSSSENDDDASDDDDANHNRDSRSYTNPLTPDLVSLPRIASTNSVPRPVQIAITENVELSPSFILPPSLSAVSTPVFNSIDNRSLSSADNSAHSSSNVVLFAPAQASSISPSSPSSSSSSSSPSALSPHLVPVSPSRNLLAPSPPPSTAVPPRPSIVEGSPQTEYVSSLHLALSSPSPLPRPTAPPSQPHLHSHTHSSSLFPRLLLSPKRLARSIARQHFSLYHNLREGEFVDQAWRRAEHHLNSPTITQLTKCFNSLTRWIPSVVLGGVSPSERAKRIEEIVMVGVTLLKAGDLHGAFAVWIGLQHRSILRLQTTLMHCAFHPSSALFHTQSYTPFSNTHLKESSDYSHTHTPPSSPSISPLTPTSSSSSSSLSSLAVSAPSVHPLSLIAHASTIHPTQPHSTHSHTHQPISSSSSSSTPPSPSSPLHTSPSPAPVLISPTHSLDTPSLSDAIAASLTQYVGHDNLSLSSSLFTPESAFFSVHRPPSSVPQDSSSSSSPSGTTPRNLHSGEIHEEPSREESKEDKDKQEAQERNGRKRIIERETQKREDVIRFFNLFTQPPNYPHLKEHFMNATPPTLWPLPLILHDIARLEEVGKFTMVVPKPLADDDLNMFLSRKQEEKEPEIIVENETKEAEGTETEEDMKESESMHTHHIDDTHSIAQLPGQLSVEDPTGKRNTVEEGTMDTDTDGSESEEDSSSRGDDFDEETQIVFNLQQCRTLYKHIASFFAACHIEPDQNIDDIIQHATNPTDSEDDEEEEDGDYDKDHQSNVSHSSQDATSIAHPKGADGHTIITNVTPRSLLPTADSFISLSSSPSPLDSTTLTSLDLSTLIAPSDDELVTHSKLIEPTHTLSPSNISTSIHMPSLSDNNYSALSHQPHPDRSDLDSLSSVS